MLNMPKKQQQQNSALDNRENNLVNTTPIPTTSPTTIVFENGTMFGAIAHHDNTTTNAANLSGTSLQIPEIVISASSSLDSLNRNRCEISHANTEESAVESTALLENTTATTTTISSPPSVGCNNNTGEEPAILQDEFDQFILNRTTSESNILESSIYSELQFPPSQHGDSIVCLDTENTSSGNGCNGGGYLSSCGGTTTVAQFVEPQISSNSRQTKRTKRKHKAKSKCTATAGVNHRASPTHYPPRYTTIFMDAHHNQFANVMTTTQHHHSGGGAADVLEQIANAAVSSSFLNGSVAADATAFMQRFQYFQQRPMVTSMTPMTTGHFRPHRSLFDGAATTATIENPLTATTTTGVPASGSFTPPLRLSFRKWFSRPSLPFIIGILALGGVACTLGGIVLGSTGLIEHSTQYLSAALLMIGIGVSLLVISGAIWRLSLPDDIDECPCYRHMEMCRNCNSPYCNSRLMGGNYLYPEFQHRPPPPSYLTSLNECAGMGLLFHPTATAQQAAYTTLRGNTPPPLYRSTNSLSVCGSSSASQHSNSSGLSTTSSIVPNLTTNSIGIVPDHSILAMNTVMENLQHQTQPLIKELNYLELD